MSNDHEKPAPDRPKQSMETPVSAGPPPTGEAPQDEQRRHPRHNVRLRVVLSSYGAQKFSSTTRDISAGGLSVEEKIPSKLLGTYCGVQIHRSMDGERIDFRCRILPDLRDPRRMQFIDPPDESLIRLAQWIESLKKTGDGA